MRTALLLLGATHAAAFAVTTLRTAVATRSASVRMEIIDDEGNSVQAIQTGISLEELRKGTVEATLDESKAEQLVLPEPEWNVAKMEVSSTDEDFEIQCNSMDYAELVIEVEPVRYARLAVSSTAALARLARGSRPCHTRAQAY